MNWKSFLGGSVLISVAFGFTLNPTSASAQVDCTKALQFDTSIIKENFTATLAILSIVTRENYDSIKKQASASILGYFDGTYDETEQKRENALNLYQSYAHSSLSLDSYSHTLSDAGAKAFAECIHDMNDNATLATAWVLNKITTDPLTFQIETKNAGASKIQITAVYQNGITKTITKTKTVVAGSLPTFDFPHNENIQATLNLSFKNLSTSQEMGFLVEWPPALPVTKLIEVSDEDFLQVSCAAGGQGNRFTMRRFQDGTILAPPGWSYEPNSRHLISATVIDTTHTGLTGEPAYYNWPEDSDAAGNVIKVSSHVQSCVGNSPDSEGEEVFAYKIRRSISSIVDVHADVDQLSMSSSGAVILAPAGLTGH